MKKIMVLFGIISVIVLVLAGCSNDDIFTEKSYSISEEEIEKVIIDVTNRELEISASEDNQIYISYYDGVKEYLVITVSESKELIVKIGVETDWANLIGTKPSVEYRKIKIKIPNNLIATFSASTTNENIKINRMSFTEQVNLNTNGGDIIFEQINVGEAIHLTAKNGNITGSLIGGWDDFSISCKIKKGECNLPTLKEDGDKALSADCNNGNISIEFIK